MNFKTKTPFINTKKPSVVMEPQELRRFAAATHIPLFVTTLDDRNEKTPRKITLLFCLYEGVQFEAEE